MSNPANIAWTDTPSKLEWIAASLNKAAKADPGDIGYNHYEHAEHAATACGLYLDTGVQGEEDPGAADSICFVGGWSLVLSAGEWCLNAACLPV